MRRPSSARILLLGAGHANLLAVGPLRAALPDAGITLIDAAAAATYSGMVPGVVAGHYDAAQARVDLASLARRHGIRFRQARITGLDPVARTVTLAAGDVLAYDLAVLDVGSHSALDGIKGFSCHAVPVKPLDGFLARLAGLAPGGPVAVIGGGIAGVEIALALRRSRPVTLIERGPRIAAALSRRAAAGLRAALQEAGVAVLTGARVEEVTAEAAILTDGQRVASALTIGAAGPRAHPWLGRDLPADAAGFVRVGPCLQVEGHPALFAVGDCAAMTHAPRPKAGVFAVRQAPVLVRNLIALQRGLPPVPYHPQGDYLKIVSLGAKTALAEWRGLSLQGRWLWHLKDRIDRRFMARLQS